MLQNEGMHEGVTAIKAVHVVELRNAIVALE